ncbi:MAG: beta-ketoacyl synthase N-terminal-like domain-containing protein [Bacteroidia bacterium]
MGFTSGENYSGVLNNAPAVKPQLFGKLNEQFCLGTISEAQMNANLERHTELRSCSKLETLSICSIADTLQHSGLSLSDPRTLLIYSTTKGNIDSLEKNPSAETAYLHAMGRCIGSYFHAAHTPLIVSNACISGLLAIIIARRFVEAGQYDSIVVCGGDLVTEFTVSGFKSFNALSSEPCKPFDKHRKGINLGEAVATLIITHDKKLLTRDSAQVVSGASANDANHISGPSRTGDGLYHALQNTFRHQAADIGFINAHGTATPFNDDMESVAFERFGFRSIPVNSLKGYYGHTLGAAGVLETIISLMALHNNQLIYSGGFSEKGLAGDISIIEKNQSKQLSAFLKTASGFGGCNAAAVFKKMQ